MDAAVTPLLRALGNAGDSMLVRVASLLMLVINIATRRANSSANGRALPAGTQDRARQSAYRGTATCALPSFIHGTAAKAQRQDNNHHASDG